MEVLFCPLPRKYGHGNQSNSTNNWKDNFEDGKIAMHRKSKKHIIIPLVLLVYLAVVAYFTYPGSNNPELSSTQYYITIGVTLVIIIAAGFFIKKREDNKEKYKDKP